MIVKAKSKSEALLSEKIWLVLIPSMATVMLAAITVVGQYLAAVAATNAAAKAATVAVKVEEVKDQLDVSTNNQERKLDEIHTLTNGAMGAQLRAYAEVMRWKADTTMKESDEEAAVRAEKMFIDHEKASKASKTNPK